MTKITCTNGNRSNRITGSRVRWTCLHCREIVAEHQSPTHGPAGYYEGKHPGGQYAERYREANAKAYGHFLRCGSYLDYAKGE